LMIQVILNHFLHLQLFCIRVHKVGGTRSVNLHSLKDSEIQSSFLPQFQ
jgi:hypothetical protein